MDDPMAPKTRMNQIRPVMRPALRPAETVVDLRGAAWASAVSVFDFAAAFGAFLDREAL